MRAIVARILDKLLITFIMLILLISSNNLPVYGQDSTPNIEFQPVQNYVIRLVNFNKDLLDLDTIKSDLPPRILQSTYDYSVTYDVDHANLSYQSSINAFLDSISTPDWTSVLNQSALQEQKEEFGRKDIFERKNGTAIDARKLEAYLSSNLPSSILPDNNRFFIFVFNNSRLDDQGYHWMNAPHINVDSQRPRSWWRLEWDYPLNYDVRFPYPAFSESEDLVILDPTAFQWYLKWRLLWNLDTNSHESYNHTLTDLINSRDSLTEKIKITRETVVRWIKEWLIGVFNIFVTPQNLKSSVNLELKMVYDTTQKKLDEITWLTSASLIREVTNSILHSDYINVQITYLDLIKDEWLSNYIASKKVSYQSYQERPPPFENWSFYDASSIWLDVNYGSSSLRQRYFNASSADVTVNGLILILDNASYVAPSYIAPWIGGLLTGLGGDLTLTMLWELDRAFMPDKESRKAGLSRVLIHEVGHAIGIPHPFGDFFISDFVNDVMGYYSGATNYSKLIKNAYLRASADNMISKVIAQFQGLREKYIQEAYLDFQHFKRLFEEAKQLHAKKLYFNSWETLVSVSKELSRYEFPKPSQFTSVSTSKARFGLFIFPIISVIFYSRYRKFVHK